MPVSLDESTLDRRNDQRQYYETRAQFFDDGCLASRINRCHRAKIERIHRHLDVTQTARVLEVGTGTGIHAAWLLELCPLSYVGVDLSASMLAVARQRLGEHVELVEAPAEELPFDDDSFDAAYCSGTLHHVADGKRGIGEMARVVKPGGRIVLSEPNPWNPLNAWHWITNPIERGQRQMRPNVFRTWFESAGIDVEHSEFFNFTPPKPEPLTPVYDAVDRLCASTPVIRRVGSMLLFVGRVTIQQPLAGDLK